MFSEGCLPGRQTVTACRVHQVGPGSLLCASERRSLSLHTTTLQEEKEQNRGGLRDGVGNGAFFGAISSYSFRGENRRTLPIICRWRRPAERQNQLDCVVSGWQNRTEGTPPQRVSFGCRSWDAGRLLCDQIVFPQRIGQQPGGRLRHMRHREEPEVPPGSSPDCDWLLEGLINFLQGRA